MYNLTPSQIWLNTPFKLSFLEGQIMTEGCHNCTSEHNRFSGKRAPIRRGSTTKKASYIPFSDVGVRSKAPPVRPGLDQQIQDLKTAISTRQGYKIL